ncbi:hypothetical protein [Sulfurimonas sp.]
MKKLIILALPILLLAVSPFDTPKPKNYSLSVFNTKSSKENKEAANNNVIICRYVCDKKIYKEQKIADAISFYKRSRFTK